MAAFFISKIMNLCKNCKHRTNDYSQVYTERCTKYIFHTDVVKGKSTYRCCHDARFRSDLCGPEGEHFEPKPTLTERIIQFFKPAPTIK